MPSTTGVLPVTVSPSAAACLTPTPWRPQVEERKASAEAAKVAAIKAECEADLAQAMPAYTASIRALDTLTKNDVSEVRGEGSGGHFAYIQRKKCVEFVHHSAETDNV
jgi:hypothetical protein